MKPFKNLKVVLANYKRFKTIEKKLILRIESFGESG